MPRLGRYIIEDDYDAEYRYDSDPVGSLQPFDPERVITGSSISKTLAPGLRLGWLVLPPQLMDAAIRLKAAFDLGTQVLSQAAFAELLRTGGFDRHLRHSRSRYRRQRARLAARLAAAAPGLRVSGLEAGLSLCIHADLPDDQAVADALKSDGRRLRGPQLLPAAAGPAARAGPRHQRHRRAGARACAWTPSPSGSVAK